MMHVRNTATFCVSPGLFQSELLRRTARRIRAQWRHSSRFASRNQLRASANSTSIPNQTVITTPLYYVNAPPHMGSAYPTIATDALARFLRLCGERTCFVTGVDQHGEKIAQAAAKSGESPQLFSSRMTDEFEELWKLLDVKHDSFVRTTSARHAAIVCEFMERVWKNGDIYKSEYEGLYCTDCEEYKDPKDLLEGDQCPIHLRKCDMRKEENYFFALSKYQERLEKFLEDNPDFVVPAKRRNEVLGWVKSGVRDFSVSRAHNPWGIPVPRDENQTIYVWFDALLGYISALLSDEEEVSLDKAIARGWPAQVHIIGKDILRFHAVYWPAMLMSAGVELPKKVFGHGFITKDGMKMGKSLGNTLDPKELVERYGSDAVRYYFLKAVDFGRDGDFSDQRFVDIVNADLANSLGNLLNRSLNLLRKYCDSTLPCSPPALDEVGEEFPEYDLLNAASVAAVKSKECYRELDFVTACEYIMDVSTKANVYIDSIAPWFALKSEDKEEVLRAERCLVNCLESVRIVAVGLSPVTTNLSRTLYAALGMEGEFDNLRWDKDMRWGLLESGMSFKKPKPVFPRLEPPVPAEPLAV